MKKSACWLLPYRSYITGNSDKGRPAAAYIVACQLINVSIKWCFDSAARSVDANIIAGYAIG